MIYQKTFTVCDICKEERQEHKAGVVEPCRRTICSSEVHDGVLSATNTNNKYENVCALCFDKIETAIKKLKHRIEKRGR